MVSINYSAREVCCKIVYYGPGLSGKTTNLQYVHQKVPQDTRGKLISLATEADRTLYFDFLPINIGTINGFQAKFQLYTVPGQVYYNATRKLVLRGVDGIVFVADSQPDKMDENIESLANLEDNLVEYGYDLDTLPLVIQYNKRDLPGILSIEELNQKLNSRGRKWFEASATTGNGVFGTLKMIIKLVLEKAKSTGSSSAVRANVAAAAPTAESPATAASPELASTQQTSAPPVAAPEPASPQPVHEHVSVTQPVAVQTGPSEATIPSQTQAAPGAAATGVAAVAALPQQQEAARPFPGSGNANAEEQVQENDSVAQMQSEKYPENSTEMSGDIEEYKVPDSGVELSAHSPQMAPSLRRRGNKKKRGFFKRLFGIR